LTQAANAITLIGEEIAGDWNAEALRDVAEVFGGTYLDYNGASGDSADDAPRELLAQFDCLLAAENAPDAQSVYSFRLPDSIAPALIVGNEARGIGRRTLKQANTVLQVPLASRNINCLNVAAAAAVMLYYLSLKQPLHIGCSTSARLRKSRPDVLLVGGSDPMELGSAIRSACAFGWEHVFLDDPANAWYDCERRIKAQGRGAARRARNPIKVVPLRAVELSAYREITVMTADQGCRAPHEVLLIGSGRLIVLPDEAASSARWSPPANWSGRVTYASLPEAPPSLYHYRQMSAIALAEAARQLGEPAPEGIYLRSRRDRYRRAVPAAERATELTLEDLAVF
jgi:tRNA G18 (ribose-2'-O)-methylase SpoU